MTKETVPPDYVDDVDDSIVRTAYNDFLTFAGMSMESEEWRKRQVVPCGYSSAMTITVVGDVAEWDVSAKVPTKVSDGQTWFRPNHVWMSERVYRFFAKLPRKRPRRFRPVNVRRLRTKLRRGC